MIILIIRETKITKDYTYYGRKDMIYCYKCDYSKCDQSQI